MTTMPRIGLGIDLHRLVPERPCVLAGITLPADVGPAGHSDGDAVLHAACDAVLGAAGLDDLGTLFSDKDPANAGRASGEFCLEAMRRVRAAGLRVVGMDVVVETERPKLAPHRLAMRQSLSRLFAVELDRVNLKGKTGEGLDAIGQGQALRATVVALLADVACDAGD